MKQLWGEICAGVPFILLGVGFALWGGLQYDLIRDDGVIGPGLLPLVSGIFLAGFGCVGVGGACWQHLTALRAERSDAADSESTVADSESTDENRSMTTVLLVFALMLAAIVLAPIIGFFLALGLLVFVLIAFVEREKIRYAVILAVGVSFVSWLIFSELLHVAFPIRFIRLFMG